MHIAAILQIFLQEEGPSLWKNEPETLSQFRVRKQDYISTIFCGRMSIRAASVGDNHTLHFPKNTLGISAAAA